MACLSRYDSLGLKRSLSLIAPSADFEATRDAVAEAAEDVSSPLRRMFSQSFSFRGPCRQASDPSPSTGAFVLGTGSAFAKRKYTTEEMIEAFHTQRIKAGDLSYDQDFVRRVFNGCKFELNSVMLPKEKLFAPLSREEYLQHRQTALFGLAQEAAEQALASWGGDRSTVTHLFWGTMTGGMDSPTLDIRLTTALGLSLDVKRTSIEGMGCLTGYRLLNLAREVVMGNPKARVLVVAADLRSALQNSLPKELTRGDVISVALFRDAGSAAVVGGNPTPQEHPLFEIMASKSRIVPDTFDIVDYQELDGGAIRLSLSPELWKLVAQEEPAFVASLLQEASVWQGLRDGKEELLPALQDWDVACHTGGPRVLEGVAKAFGSSPDRFRSSWKVMRENGNLSGASNLAVLHEQAQLKALGSRWVLGLSMGPGVCLEGLVLRQVAATPATRVATKEM